MYIFNTERVEGLLIGFDVGQIKILVAKNIYKIFKGNN